MNTQQQIAEFQDRKAKNTRRIRKDMKELVIMSNGNWTEDFEDFWTALVNELSEWHQGDSLDHQLNLHENNVRRCCWWL